jgi:glycosyltransferase involved in cell wall biosynthesis
MVSFHQVLSSHELGGAGQLGLHVAYDLMMRGQTSKVWIPGEGPAKSKAEKWGLNVNTYDATRLFSPSKLRVLVANYHIWRKLPAYSPALVHFHSPYVYRAMMPMLKLSHAKSMVHIHLDEDEAGLRWALKCPPDLVVTCARFLEPYVRRILPEQSQESQRIIAIPNPVDTERFYPGNRVDAKRRMGAPLDVPLALMLANLAPHKGQDVAIKATAQLKNEGLHIALWLAGEERGGMQDYTHQLVTLCAELGVKDHVQFLGHRDDAADLLRSADFFLLPSTREGLPLSILEAQASKVPVLAAPAGGTPEIIIDGKTGFLIDASHPDSYADRIKRLLNNPSMAESMTANAYLKVVSNHTSLAYFERLWSLYQDLPTITN